MGTSGAAEIIYKGKSLGFTYFGHDGFYLYELVMYLLLDTIEKVGLESVHDTLETWTVRSSFNGNIYLDEGEHANDCDICGDIDITECIDILVQIQEWVQTTAANILTDKWENLYPTHTFHSMSEFITWATVQLARPQISIYFTIPSHIEPHRVDLRPAIRIIFPSAAEETVERLNVELSLLPAL